MDEKQKRITQDDARRLNAECHGAPKYFTYPADLPYSEQERQWYEEAAAKIKPIIEHQRKRGRRRRR